MKDLRILLPRELSACLFIGISHLLDTLLGCKSEDAVEGQLAWDTQLF